jgi:hypothetical protein
MLRIPDTASPFGDFGQDLVAPSGLNVTILSPDYGSVVTPSIPWWTFGFGKKTFPAVVRVTNNTPFTPLRLQSLLKSGAVFISSPIPDINDDLPSGTTKDYSFDISVDENLHGPIPANLTVTAMVGRPQGLTGWIGQAPGGAIVTTELNFTLNL